jgi:hypothetical protein
MFSPGPPIMFSARRSTSRELEEGFAWIGLDTLLKVCAFPTISTPYYLPID